MSDTNEATTADVVLVGAGIMSTTLAVFLKELQPHLRIEIVERLARRGAGELGRVEQCRHRPRRQLRAELHAERKTAASTSPRRSRSTSSSTCRASSGPT